VAVTTKYSIYNKKEKINQDRSRVWWYKRSENEEKRRNVRFEFGHWSLVIHRMRDFIDKDRGGHFEFGRFKIWNLKFECTNGDMRAQMETCVVARCHIFGLPRFHCFFLTRVLLSFTSKFLFWFFFVKF